MADYPGVEESRREKLALPDRLLHTGNAIEYLPGETCIKPDNGGYFNCIFLFRLFRTYLCRLQGSLQILEESQKQNEEIESKKVNGAAIMVQQTSRGFRPGKKGKEPGQPRRRRM